MISSDTEDSPIKRVPRKRVSCIESSSDEDEMTDNVKENRDSSNDDKKVAEEPKVDNFYLPLFCI